MTKEEIMEGVTELVENGAGEVEIFEWLEDNTDLSHAEILEALRRYDRFETDSIEI